MTILDSHNEIVVLKWIELLQGVMMVQIAPVTDIEIISPSSDKNMGVLRRYLEHHILAEGLPLPEARMGKETLLIDLRSQNLGEERVDPTITYRREKVSYPIRLYRSQLLLGPLYIPTIHNVPCPCCLDRRWAANRTIIEQQIVSQMQQGQTVELTPQFSPFVLEAFLQMLYAIFQGYAYNESYYQKNGAYPLYLLDLKSLLVTQYTLLQDATCPVCSSLHPDSVGNAQIELLSRYKQHLCNYRLKDITDYQIPLSALVNPICGILGSAMFIDVYNPLIVPVTGAFHTRNKWSIYEVFWSGRTNTLLKSQNLALLEGLERYAGQIPRGKDVAVFDSYQKLAPDAIDPSTCGLYPSEFYQNNTSCRPFAPEQHMPWFWGYSFRNKRPVLVPEQLTYYLDSRPGQFNFVQDCSNGCATGSCMEEAILHGLLELIERDAFLLTWYAQLCPPRIDPSTCCHPEIRMLLAAIEKQGYDLFLFDLRLDIPVPVVLGLARLKKPGLGNIVVSASAGLQPEQAILGLLYEMTTSLLNYPKQLKSRLPEIQAMAQDFSKVRDLIHHALLYGLPEMAQHTSFLFQNPVERSITETYLDWAKNYPQDLDLHNDLRYCIDLVLNASMDVIVVDQTCPEQVAVGLKTVRVIVPGLLPIDFGWQRDRALSLPRLRTVPRTTGHQENDFEPDIACVIPHPFS